MTYTNFTYIKTHLLSGNRYRVDVEFESEAAFYRQLADWNRVSSEWKYEPAKFSGASPTLYRNQREVYIDNIGGMFKPTGAENFKPPFSHSGCFIYNADGQSVGLCHSEKDAAEMVRSMNKAAPLAQTRMRYFTTKRAAEDEARSKSLNDPGTVYAIWLLGRGQSIHDFRYVVVPTTILKTPRETTTSLWRDGEILESEEQSCSKSET